MNTIAVSKKYIDQKDERIKEIEEENKYLTEIIKIESDRGTNLDNIRHIIALNNQIKEANEVIEKINEKLDWYLDANQYNEFYKIMAREIKKLSIRGSDE